MCFFLPRLSLAVCHQVVPDPLNFFVTHWSKDLWSQMSYSFVKTGGSGEAYDIIAEDVQGKVFFAGEVMLLLSYIFVRCILIQSYRMMTVIKILLCRIVFLNFYIFFK